jgi:toxin ParE1/3/4
VPELRDRGYTEFRELITAPYRVVYKSVNREVWLVAIIDGRRDLGELIFERARRMELP